MNNKSKMIVHHYFLFEFGKNGYVLDCFIENVDKQRGQDKYEELIDFIGSREMKGWSSQQILNKLGYSHKYPINTPREKLYHEQNGHYLLDLRTSSSENNVLYYVCSYWEIENFSTLERSNAARRLFFSEFLTEPEGEEKAMEMFMN